MKTCISAERLATYRKTFGSLTTQELRAIVEGRKPHKLSEETVEALRLLLEQRNGGGQVTVQPAGIPGSRHDSPPGRDSSAANPPGVEPEFERLTGKRTPLPTPTQAAPEKTSGTDDDSNYGVGKTTSTVVTVLVAIAALYLKNTGMVSFFTAVLLGVVALTVILPVIGAIAKSASRKGGGQQDAALLKPRAAEERRSFAANPPSAEAKRDMNREASEQPLPGRGKRKLLAGIYVAFVLVIAVLALPATRDELRWLRVADDESVADEQAYLDAWPDGRHAGEVRAQIQRRAWSVALGLDSIEGFQAYLDAVPEGEHVAEARVRIEALKWERAVAANDLEHFEGFLRDYPDSQQATRARAQIEALSRIQATAQQFAFQYPVNQPLSYALGLKLKMNMDIQAGAESLKLKMAFDLRYTVKLTALSEPQDGVTPVRLEPSDLEGDWDITGPAGHIGLNLRGSQMKGTQNGVVIIDTARGVGMAEAQEFKKEIAPLYLSGQADLDARGNVKKIRGDRPFIEFWTEACEGQLGFFGSVFPERPVAVGGSWKENLSLKKMGQVMLEGPGLQGTVTFTRQPDSIVRGTPLATFNISAPHYQEGLKGSMEQGGQRTRLNISHFGRRANGTFHFDPARGVLVDSQITADGDGAMRAVVQGQGADITLDMNMELRTRLLEEKAAGTTR